MKQQELILKQLIRKLLTVVVKALQSLEMAPVQEYLLQQKIKKNKKKQLQ